jgi:hypothetical protein
VRWLVRGTASTAERVPRPPCRSKGGPPAVQGGARLAPDRHRNLALPCSIISSSTHLELPMSNLDNANPTIHSSAASSSSGIFGAASRRAGGGGGASRTVRDLWAEEGADDFYEEDLEQAGTGEGDDVGDDIDAEEIFGASPTARGLLPETSWLSSLASGADRDDLSRTRSTCSPPRTHHITKRWSRSHLNRSLVLRMAALPYASAVANPTHLHLLARTAATPRVIILRSTRLPYLALRQLAPSSLLALGFDPHQTSYGPSPTRSTL